MDLALINKIFVIFINIIGVLLAIWVYLANRKNKINQTYLLMTVLNIFWINCAYLSNISSLDYFVQFWAKLGYGVVSIWLIFFYFFTIYFLKEERRFSAFNKFFVGIGLFLFLFSGFSNLLVKDAEFTQWGAFPVFGVGKLLPILKF